MVRKLILASAVGVILAMAAYWSLQGTHSTTGQAGNTPNTAALQELATGEMANFTLDKNPKEVPDFVFVDEKGQPRKLSDFRGKLLLVNFWATWCAPCRHEMPSLDALETTLGGASFTVLPISMDRGGVAVARKFFDSVKASHLGLYVDTTGSSGRTMGAYGLPLSVLVGRDGKELGRIMGPAEWNSPDAKKLITAAIAGKY